MSSPTLCLPWQQYIANVKTHLQWMSSALNRNSLFRLLTSIFNKTFHLLKLSLVQSSQHYLLPDLGSRPLDCECPPRRLSRHTRVPCVLNVCSRWTLPSALVLRPPLSAAVRAARGLTGGHSISTAELPLIIRRQRPSKAPLTCVIVECAPCVSTCAANGAGLLEESVACAERWPTICVCESDREEAGRIDTEQCHVKAIGQSSLMERQSIEIFSSNYPNGTNIMCTLLRTATWDAFFIFAINWNKNENSILAQWRYFSRLP